MAYIDYLADERMINDADMKAVANTEYASRIMDLRDASRMMIRMTFSVDPSATAGVAQLLWQPTDRSGANLGSQVPLMTAISTQVDAQVAYFSWGGGIATAVLNGTIGSNVDVTMHIFRTGYLILEVTTQNDAATSATADVDIIAQRYSHL
jgi:hypothetical protein